MPRPKNTPKQNQDHLRKVRTCIMAAEEAAKQAQDELVSVDVYYGLDVNPVVARLYGRLRRLFEEELPELRALAAYVQLETTG
jgi:hypothetical protein